MGPGRGAEVAEQTLEALVSALRAARRGDLGVRLPDAGDESVASRAAREWNGFAGDVERVAAELGRVAVDLRDGQLGGRVGSAHREGPFGALAAQLDGVVASVTARVRDIARVAGAVARGDSSARLTFEARGELLELKNTVNTMAAKLESFGAEVTRVSRQLDAGVRRRPVAGDVSGLWRELSENVGLAEQIAIASKSKSAFLATMSHELRTPLNVVLVLSSLFAEDRVGGLTERQAEYARTIHDAATSLLALLDEVLDLSKIEAGRMQLDPRDVELEALAAWARATFRPLAERKGLRFHVEVADAAPVTIRTDALRVRQILQNLLSNALKFTTRGAVSLRVHVPRCGFVAFVVADTGLGIEAAKQEVVFEPFRQADGSTAGTYGGTGLGLSISRGLAERLGGTIALESEVGQGSAFTLELPERLDAIAAARGDEPHACETPAEREPEPSIAIDGAEGSDALAGRRVLVIDDDVRNIFVLASVLDIHGAEVVFAEGGRPALELARDAAPIDVVLLDIEMPEVDGYEVLRALRGDARRRDLPVVAITTHALPGERERCLDAGAAAYVTKPIDPRRLVEVIAGLVGER